MGSYVRRVADHKIELTEMVQTEEWMLVSQRDVGEEVLVQNRSSYAEPVQTISRVLRRFSVRLEADDLNRVAEPIPQTFNRSAKELAVATGRI